MSIIKQCTMVYKRLHMAVPVYLAEIQTTQFYVYCWRYASRQHWVRRFQKQLKTFSVRPTDLNCLCALVTGKIKAGSGRHLALRFTAISPLLQIIKRWYYPPPHRLNVNVLLSNITVLWFLLFSMCYSLHVAVKVRINCSFLHLYLRFFSFSVRQN